MSFITNLEVDRYAALLSRDSGRPKDECRDAFIKANYQYDEALKLLNGEVKSIEELNAHKNVVITLKKIQWVIDVTGAGMIEAKKALREADGDEDKAIEIIRNR